MNTADYQESLNYLYGLQKMGIKLGLTNINCLLKALGNPQQQFPSIHVAGSNGKGSTCVYLANILQAAGYKVGLYTSPHLIDFTERIRINGENISRQSVVEITNRLKTVANNPAFDSKTNYPTYFEMVTALGFEYFREQKVDIAILETGMGGRLDATNVVHPLLSIITNLCLEHQIYLGDTLAEIAYEKAGIIKNHVPVFTAVNQPEALKCLEETCRKHDAPFHKIQDETSYTLKQRWPNQLFDIKTPLSALNNLSINLLGEYQVQNALLATYAAQFLAQTGWKISADAIREGLTKTAWPGRMQVISKRPWLLLDGAHNPGAIKELMQNLSLFPHQRLIMVMGIMQDKDIAEILSLLQNVDTLILTRADIPRSANPQKLAGLIKNPKIKVMVSESVSGAIEEAKKLAQEDDLICITGSLYVVGEAQAHIYKLPLETIRSVQ